MHIQIYNDNTNSNLNFYVNIDKKNKRWQTLEEKQWYLEEMMKRKWDSIHNCNLPQFSFMRIKIS